MLPFKSSSHYPQGNAEIKKMTTQLLKWPIPGRVRETTYFLSGTGPININISKGPSCSKGLRICILLQSTLDIFSMNGSGFPQARERAWPLGHWNWTGLHVCESVCVRTWVCVGQEGGGSCHYCDCVCIWSAFFFPYRNLSISQKLGALNHVS